MSWLPHCPRRVSCGLVQAGGGGAGSTPGFTPPPPLPPFPVCLQPVHCGSRENAETSKTSPSLGVLTVRAHGWLGPGSKGRVEQGSRSP